MHFTKFVCNFRTAKDICMQFLVVKTKMSLISSIGALGYSDFKNGSKKDKNWFFKKLAYLT